MNITTLLLVNLVSSLDESCNDNEYFCQLCETPCVSCGNDIFSMFYKPRCDDCGCEFQWWWIPGLLIFITCVSCACALICYHSHTSRAHAAKINDAKQLKLADANSAPIIHIQDEISNANDPKIEQLKSNNNDIDDNEENEDMYHSIHGVQGVSSHIPLPTIANQRGEVSETASVLSRNSLQSKQSSKSSKSSRRSSRGSGRKHERSKGPLESQTMSTFMGVEAAISDKSKIGFHHNKLDSVDEDLVLKEYKLDDKGTTIGILPWKGMTIIDESDEDEKGHNRDGTIICHEDGIDEALAQQQLGHAQPIQPVQSASYDQGNINNTRSHPGRNTEIPNAAQYCISLSPSGSPQQSEHSRTPSPRTYSFVNSSFPPLPDSRKNTGTEDIDEPNTRHSPSEHNKYDTMIIHYHHLSPQPPLAVVNKKKGLNTNVNSNKSSISSSSNSEKQTKAKSKNRNKIKKKKGDQKYRIIVEDVDDKPTKSKKNRSKKKQSIDSGITIRARRQTDEYSSNDEHEHEMKAIIEEAPDEDTPEEKDDDIDMEDFEFPILEYKTEINKFSSFMAKDIDNIPIGIVTQCSMDRLLQLKAMCTYWNGIISVTIYIHKMMEIWKIRSVFEDITTNNHGRNVCIQIHVVFANDNDEYYPINYLRNVALRACKCKYVFLNDIDFIPSYDLYHKLLSNLPKSREALVIPAIEVMDDKWKYDTPNIDEIFKLKPAELILGFEKEEIKQFQIEDYPNRQQATNYLKWLITNNNYQVDYQHGYEPYIIVKNDHNLCEYDERFTGNGMNKIIHIAKLSKKHKFKFNVFCDGFVVTLQHEKSRDYHRTYGKDKDKKRELWIKSLFNLAMSELED